MVPGGDSGTTGGGGIYEAAGQRRIYAQNNFGDIVRYTTSAGNAGPLTSTGVLIDGITGNFQSQSPSGDTIVLPTGDVLYFYTDGENFESTLDAIGVLLLTAASTGFTDQLDNFVAITAAGMTRLDEMTVSNISFSGSTMTALLFLDGDSTANGSKEDIFHAPLTITFDENIAGAVVPEPSSLVLLGVGVFCLAGYGSRRRRKPSVESTV